MDSKFFSNRIVFLFFSASVLLGFCQGEQSTCVHKLLACQEYLKDPISPPASCCQPLKEMVANEVGCLCGLINNPGIMENFKITEEDASNLAKACGATSDTSLCKNSTSPSDPAVSVTNSSTTDSSAKENSGHSMQNWENFSFIALFANLFFLILSL